MSVLLTSQYATCIHWLSAAKHTSRYVHTSKIELSGTTFSRGNRGATPGA